jgi:hypothetical protein
VPDERSDAKLANLADGDWYAIRKNGEESLQRLLPNEEVLESLAARVRPSSSRRTRCTTATP